jgi:LysR family transcriptional regulator, hypochlorite-specific transcription factor HypT
MDLNWLADFVALTESGSFSRAAARRHVTQPAFSRRIRALEQWTGAPLFERGPRAVTLTEAGRRLLPWAETLRRQIDEARTDARSALPDPVEPLRIAATHSLSLTFFSEWLVAIGGPLSLGPVQLASESLAGCERLMEEGQAQFVLAHSHPATPVRLDPASFSSMLVGADALVPVAAPGSPPPSTAAEEIRQATPSSPTARTRVSAAFLPTISRRRRRRPASSRSSLPITQVC